VAITFPSDSTPKQYTNRCVKVKVGTVVTFKGAFAAHPLDAKGGDTPSPIPRITDTDPDGGALALTMTAPGNYGFVCDFHPGSMFGVIQVVP
jgi:plastocyanin